jgi:hypothetical protein
MLISVLPKFHEYSPTLEVLAMPQGKEVLLGLNMTGVIVCVVLLFFCLPLAWLPWVIDSMKSDPNYKGD